MPAASSAIKMSWIPRGEGKGGMFQNATYHDMDPASTYFLVNGVVDHNTWRVRYNDVQYGATTGANYATSIEFFNRYTGTTPTLSSNVVAGFTLGGNPNYVQNMTTAAAIRTTAGNMPLGAGTRNPLVFAPVKNRLYMSNGTDAPAISADATANSCIPWGFAAQTANLGYQIASPNALGAGTNAAVVGGTQGTCNTTNVANSVVTWVSGPNFQYFKVGQVIYVNGVYWTVATLISNTQITLSGNAGALAGVPFSYAPTGLNGTIKPTGVPTPATNVVDTWIGSAAAFPVLNSGAIVAGNPLYLSVGAAAVTPTVKYTVGSITGAAAGTITVTYAETAGYVVRQGQFNFGNISFEGGSYRYGVSYYNPTSGHTSNLSPIVEVKDGVPLNSNVSITISNIIATNDANYTKIILWRSGKTGSNLFPLAILNNDTGNTLGGTITYTDTLGDDTALGTMVGGPGKTPAPRGENLQPPSDLNYATYWDGRFWGASQTNVGVLYFSGRSAGNNEDISVGVPEECWPLNFTRTIPEADGRITGLRAVGGNLFVLTDNNIYAVTGNTRDNYGLQRVSSKGRGTSHTKTCVLPAEDSNSTDVLVHFGNDGRGYFLFGSGGDFPVSYPIQSNLSPGNSPVCVGVQHTNVSTYVVVGTSLVVYLYDVERKIWMFRTVGGALNGGAYCYAEGLLNNVVVQLFGSSQTAGTVYLAEQQSGSPVNFDVATNTVSPGQADRKDDKTLQSVTVYYPNRTTPLVVSAYIDNPYLSATALTEVPNTGAYAALFESPDARVFVPQGTVARGRLFAFEVFVSGPTQFSENISEISATWTYSQADEAKGANL